MLPYGIGRKPGTNLWYFFNAGYLQIGQMPSMSPERNDYTRNVPDEHCVRCDNSAMFRVIERLEMKKLNGTPADEYRFEWNFAGMAGTSREVRRFLARKYVSQLKKIFTEAVKYTEKDYRFNGTAIAKKYLPYFFVVEDGRIAVSHREYNAPGAPMDGKQEFNMCEIEDPGLEEALRSTLCQADTNLVSSKGHCYFVYQNRNRCHPELFSAG